MPELPEAENICRALDRALRGRKITRVEVFSPAMRTSLLPPRPPSSKASPSGGPVGADDMSSPTFRTDARS